MIVVIKLIIFFIKLKLFTDASLILFFKHVLL